MASAQTILSETPDIIAVETAASLPDAGEVDVLVVGVTGKKDDLTVVTDLLDGPAAQRLTELARLMEVGSKPGSVTVLPAPDRLGAKRVAFAGLSDTPAGDDAGSAAEITDEALRRAAGAAARTGRKSGRVAFALDSSRPEAVVIGAGLGSFVPKKVTGDMAEAADADSDSAADSSDSDSAADGSLVVLTGDAGFDQAALARANAIVECVCVARDFVNCPPNLLYPESFAERAATLGRTAGLEVEILDEATLAARGYGGILGVGQGSSRPPRLLRLSYRGGDSGASVPHVALVGKGVTFDTGGISIKPAAGMEQMTMDMGGAAAVIATVLLAAKTEIALDVTATVPMAENMPSATAYRPGDVITHYGGTTTEVQNTDAEGRLILADAIVRACEDDPDFLIDTATLTGAQMVALGKLTPGVMGTEEFRDRVAELSQSVGENGWPMPLPEELREGLESSVADLTNVTPHRWGGMLSAGIFLREFVDEGVEWAHIDIAGPAYNDSKPDGYRAKGATGVPVRTLFAVLEDIAN